MAAHYGVTAIEDCSTEETEPSAMLDGANPAAVTAAAAAVTFDSQMLQTATSSTAEASDDYAVNDQDHCFLVATVATN